MNSKISNRMIQIILLMIIAGGFAAIALTLRSSQNRNSAGVIGGGMPGGGPGGAVPDSGMAAGAPKPGLNTTGKKDQTAVAVEAEIVTLRSISRYIKVNGDVVSDVSVDIFPDAAGKLVERRVHLGDSVRKGDVLAVVDPSGPGAVYSTSSVYSTIAGTITAIKVNVGDTVSKNSSIAVVGDLSNLSLITYIPERYINYLKVGLNAEVSFEAFPAAVFKAQVTQLNPVLDSNSRSLEIKLAILNADTRVRVGMFASIRLVTEEKNNVPAVPTTAISNYYNDTVVFVIKDDTTVERRVVTTGLTSDDRVEIVKGLAKGEMVVIQGTSALTDGIAVHLVNDPQVRRTK